MLITKIYKADEIQAAAAELKKGELIAFPTETVYGLGADATNEQAVKRVYLAKGRPSDNPLIVTVSSLEMVKKYVVDLNEDAQKLIKHFWPGPLTLIFKIKPGSLSKAVTGGLETAAFRMPANRVTRELITRVGVPLVGPSANTSGKPSPTTAAHVFHDLEGRIAGIVDDGPTTVGVESTILDMSVTTPVVLRPGAVLGEELERFLAKKVVFDRHKVAAEETPKAPGMKYKHYAPAAQVLIVKEADWSAALAWAKKQHEEVGVMALNENLQSEKPVNCLVYDLGKDIYTASQHLFAGLRYFDNKKQIHYILAAAFPEEGLGAAYMNRLRKAAGNQFFKN
ncbi:L-threonylcarbamoyladenylate synthase [Liquorilactobacillus capillatus]|uniref:Threonylcarbamoyl-AMP synthase n=1 Tax=Liquorilactobacillus capillatus DSM 19910 TaxID=1423731 RepID=A0A0R1M6X7_9LACO|nr:L-threonylcarbamoyladenylate synthase [Liquorilactobacillus capillatus]KRL00139.1 Sua5 YciO YrdC YwlC family protein [Liquorilactobacillus capillatus DSM 19910]